MAMLAEADFDKATPRHEETVQTNPISSAQRQTERIDRDQPKVVRMFTKAETLTQLKSMCRLLCLKKGDECWWISDDYPSKIKTVCKHDHSVWTQIPNDRQAEHEPQGRHRSEGVHSDDTVYARARPSQYCS